MTFTKGHEINVGRKFSKERNMKMAKTLTGRKMKVETIKKISGENNYGWKGDNVGYCSLHQWLRRHLPKPELCLICNNAPPTDMACITGVYNRDFDNWKWLCHKCHIASDGRLDHLNRLHLSRIGKRHSEEAKRRISEACRRQQRDPNTGQYIKEHLPKHEVQKV